MPYAHREAWLAAAVEYFKPDFATHGSPLKTKVRVACGWPSRGGLASRARTVGECWSTRASADGANEIFLSPVLADPIEVLSVLVHELCHAAVGNKGGHREPFRSLAIKMGLRGPMRSTIPGPVLTACLNILSAQLGPYPHARLNGQAQERRKQGTRLIKCVCPACGYLARITQKWIEIGLPLCPCAEEFLVPGGTIDIEEARRELRQLAEITEGE
jgi:hypothetical protein